ncbi:MAG: TIGR00730 family Rossman fold protein [Burkholderiales bacterium]|nr:MAG: TIGR00730 family Rossman fold protein [Burkholderiales bacterium]
MSGAPAICVFCGAKSGHGERFAEAARATGELAARNGWSLVYGGGHVGLMGELADGALAAGGEVIGVIPSRLQRAEVAHPGLARLEVVPDMAARKSRMIEISDAFAALPGGLGTLDELYEVLTLSQLAYHAKPMFLVNVDGFFDRLIAFARHQIDTGLIVPDHWERMQVVDSPQSLFEALRAAAPRPVS